MWKIIFKFKHLLKKLNEKIKGKNTIFSVIIFFLLLCFCLKKNNMKLLSTIGRQDNENWPWFDKSVFGWFSNGEGILVILLGNQFS